MSLTAQLASARSVNGIPAGSGLPIFAAPSVLISIAENSARVTFLSGPKVPSS